MLSEAMLFAISMAAESAVVGGERPTCSALLRGQMWPLEANSDSKLATKLARQGRLEICVRGSWKYHWIMPAVHIDQLRREAKGRSGKS